MVAIKNKNKIDDLLNSKSPYEFVNKLKNYELVERIISLNDKEFIEFIKRPIFSYNVIDYILNSIVDSNDTIIDSPRSSAIVDRILNISKSKNYREEVLNIKLKSRDNIDLMLFLFNLSYKASEEIVKNIDKYIDFIPIDEFVLHILVNLEIFEEKKEMDLFRLMLENKNLKKEDKRKIFAYILGTNILSNFTTDEYLEDFVKKYGLDGNVIISILYHKLGWITIKNIFEKRVDSKTAELATALIQFLGIRKNNVENRKIPIYNFDGEKLDFLSNFNKDFNGDSNSFFIYLAKNLNENRFDRKYELELKTILEELINRGIDKEKLFYFISSIAILPPKYVKYFYKESKNFIEEIEKLFLIAINFVDVTVLPNKNMVNNYLNHRASELKENYNIKNIDSESIYLLNYFFNTFYIKNEWINAIKINNLKGIEKKIDNITIRPLTTNEILKAIAMGNGNLRKFLFDKDSLYIGSFKNKKLIEAYIFDKSKIDDIYDFSDISEINDDNYFNSLLMAKLIMDYEASQDIIEVDDILKWYIIDYIEHGIQFDQNIERFIRRS